MPLWFQIDLHWYKFPPQSYIGLIFIENTGTFDCQIRIREKPSDNDSYAILGISFLQNYFQVYDMVTNQVAHKAYDGSLGEIVPVLP